MMKFEDMTREQKAVAIAKDVLKQIKAKTYRAKTGVYVAQKIRRTPPPDYSIKDLKSCQVCALGSCIVSAARLGGQKEFERLVKVDRVEEFSRGGDAWVPVTYLTDKGTKWEALAPYFGDQVIRDMESAFERDESFGGSWDAIEKYADVKSPTIRLQKIMRNVIRNKGRFVP